MAHTPTANHPGEKNSSVKKEYGFFFYFLKWALIVLIILFSLSLLTKPIRKKWSDNYVEKGNIFLEQKKYLTAEIQYKKALLLYSKNQSAKNYSSLAKKSQSDVTLLYDFYNQRNLTREIEYFDQAKNVPADEVEAAKSSKLLIENEEYQLAIIAAKTSTEMDKYYRDGWLYLGISNLLSAERVELIPQNKVNYKNEAIRCLNAAKSLDPEYEPTQKYLDEAEKL